MSFERISVVVQGPVQAYQGRGMEEGITRRCLDSVRTHLPGATLILSTWPDQDLSGLDYDLLVESDDPGPNADAYCPRNYHRQLVSSREGLKRVTTDYAVKLRSDNYLVGNQFVERQQDYPLRHPNFTQFAERVVINANLFRRYSKGHRILYHPSDFFYYGRTEDLLKIWDQPLFPQQPFSDALLAGFYGLRKGQIPLEAEQVICQLWLLALDPNAPMIHRRIAGDAAAHDYWDKFVASNILLDEPAEIGLGLRKLSLRRKKRVNEFTHHEWCELYNRHCGGTLPMLDGTGWKEMQRRRLAKLPFSWLKTRLLDWAPR
ncbi:WavE lipopolysaccharide synthesis family protein [Marinobacter hydrocarbonoclasticus]|nr:WavE lipopolysaccharide synthesis family protein [Marinobacter nauticus]